MTQTGNTVVIDDPEDLIVRSDGDFDISDAKFGIIAVPIDWRDDVKRVKILHFAGFENSPTKEEFDILTRELKEDEELGLCAVEFELLPSPPELTTAFIVAAKKAQRAK